MNVQTILRLSQKGAEKDFEEYGVGLPPHILEALKEEIAKDKKDAAMAAAKEIVAVLKYSDDTVTRAINEIRLMKAKIKSIKGRLNKITVARKYGEQTGNFVPLVMALGLGSQISKCDTENVVTEVPKDWVPDGEPVDNTAGELS